MNHVISKLIAKVSSSNEDQQKAEKYRQMQATDGWKIQAEYLLYLRGLMAEDLLSDRFTQMKPIEKDILQRAYAMVDQMILFLMNPLAKARTMDAIKYHNLKMEATLKGATGRKSP